MQRNVDPISSFSDVSRSCDYLCIIYIEWYRYQKFQLGYTWARSWRPSEQTLWSNSGDISIYVTSACGKFRNEGARLFICVLHYNWTIYALIREATHAISVMQVCYIVSIFPSPYFTWLCKHSGLFSYNIKNGIAYIHFTQFGCQITHRRFLAWGHCLLHSMSVSPFSWPHCWSWHMLREVRIVLIQWLHAYTFQIVIMMTS